MPNTDVYKRQAFGRRWPLIRLEVRRKLARPEIGGGVAPVSYTHLDVYKRQGLYDNDLRALASAHSIELLEGDTYVLLDRELYREDTGLDASDAGGKGLFF